MRRKGKWRIGKNRKKRKEENGVIEMKGKENRDNDKIFHFHSGWRGGDTVSLCQPQQQ